MYTAIHFYLEPYNSDFTGILSAFLDELDFAGIYEEEKKIIAYVNDEPDLDQILGNIQTVLQKLNCELSWKQEVIQEQNWNEIWENNFEPVIVSNQCLIRAPFHKNTMGCKYQIIIEPKMSFGTGHHHTTRLMIEYMLKMDFNGKAVLDMGCGTGILAILAAKIGASRIVAVDIDKWAYENSLENCRKNTTDQIQVMHGGINQVQNDNFDILLANINRNILLEQASDYYKMLNRNGILLLSGILLQDLVLLRDAMEKRRFNFTSSTELEGWVAMKFERN